MADLTFFQKGVIVGAPFSGVSVTITAALLSVGRNTVSTVMSAYFKHTHTHTNVIKHNSGQKSKLNNIDKKVSKRIVKNNM